MTVRRIVPALLLVLLLSACGGRSPEASFYTLEPIAINPTTPALTLGAMTVGLRQVDIPPVLRRPQIVLIDGEQVTSLEYRRWSEPLDAAMLRILGSSLRARFDTAAILAYPWPASFRPEQVVSIRVERFNGLPGQSLELSGVWTLENLATGGTLRLERFSIVEPVAGGSIPELVHAHSKALARLADELTVALASQSQQ